jgi:Indigoidine synthase A like protein
MSSAAAHRRLRTVLGHAMPSAPVGDTQTSVSDAKFDMSTVNGSTTALQMCIKDDVKAALDSGRAVVALESTIISHGMPYPQNYETALQVEQVVRDNGAVPATIAIIKGVIHIGMFDSL